MYGRTDRAGITGIGSLANHSAIIFVDRLTTLPFTGSNCRGSPTFTSISVTFDISPASGPIFLKPTLVPLKQYTLLNLILKSVPFYLAK